LIAEFKQIYKPFCTMKKFLSIAFFALCATTHIHAQAPDTQWARLMESVPPGNFDKGLALPFDSHTDIFSNTTVCGYFADTLLLHDGTLLVSDPGVYSTFLARYDDKGNLLWATVIRQTSEVFADDGGRANICVDNEGNTYLTGVLVGEIANLGNGITVARSCTDNCAETFTAKFDADGKAVWANTVKADDATSVVPSGLEVNNNGQLFMIAFYNAPSLDFGVGFFFDNIDSDHFLAARYDAATGTPQVVRFFGNGATFATAFGADINDSGLLAIQGDYVGELDLGNGVGLAPLSEFSDYFVMVMDENLVPQWARNVNSEDYIDILDIDIDNSGNVYMAIDFSKNIRLEESEVLLSPIEEYGAAIMRLKENEFSIPVFIPYSGDSYPLTAVTTDPFGNFYAGGLFDASLSPQVAGQTIESNGCFDALVMQGNPDGLILWVEALGSEGCEAIANFSGGNSLSTDPAGNLYVTGIYVEGFEWGGTQGSGSGLFLSKYKSGISSVGNPDAPVSDLAISPNPCAQDFKVTLDEAPTTASTLSICDQYGRVVHQQSLTDRVSEVRTDLPAGMYVALVQDGTRLYRSSVVVTR
jgi:hypothetical protein